MFDDNLKRREGFNQDVSPCQVSTHYHASFDYKDLVYYAGSRYILTSLTDVLMGQKIKIDPIYFIEATSAKLYMTGMFSTGGVDSYTLSFYCDDLIYTTTQATSLSSELIEFDISDEFKNIFINSSECESYIMAKVSNAATSLAVCGLTLRVCMQSKDTFGYFNTKVSKYLANKFLLAKNYLVKKNIQMQETEYISELKDDFHMR